MSVRGHAANDVSLPKHDKPVNKIGEILWPKYAFVYAVDGPKIWNHSWVIDEIDKLLPKKPSALHATAASIVLHDVLHIAPQVFS